MDIPPFLHDLSRQPIMQRLMVVAAYGVMAKAVDIFVNRILKRLAAAYTATDLDDKAIDILHTPIVLSVFLIGILHAVSMKPPRPRGRSGAARPEDRPHAKGQSGLCQ